MQYNKQQFNKVKDKKVMKKVKKQWVVVSVATLAFLGTTAYTMGGTEAHADGTSGGTTNNSNTTNGNTTSGTQNNNQSAGSGNAATNTNTAATNTNTNTASTNGTSASSGASASAPVVTVGTTNGQAPSFNNNDDSATYAQQIQQGYQDAYNGKANNSGTLTGQAINYYNAGYAAAAAVMNDYNQKTQGIGAGTQDYTYYGNTPNRKDDAGNVKVASLSSSGASLANNTAANTTASNNSSSGAASSNGSGFTGASTTNPQTALTDGTPQNYNSPDSPYRGGADTPYSAYTSTQNYEQQLLSKFSNVNNVSVQSSNQIGASIIPQASDAIIQQARQQYANYAGLAKAFDTATNMTLAMQGYNDAESGKWVGIAPGQASKGNQDFYMNSFAGIRNSSNPYDQAYLGAKDSIANSFDSSNNFKVNTAFNPVNTSNQYYNMGYNDVVNQETAKGSGVVFVSNGGQFFNVLTGQTGAMNAGGGNVANNVIKIKIVGDIDLTALTGTGGEYANINATGSSITIDGQNHMMDFHDMDYTFTNSNFTDLYLQNFQTLYAANYYGPFRVGSNDNIHYSNINYIGGQLLSATSQNVYFSGNVNVLNPVNYNNLGKSAYYNSPFTQNVLTVGGGNQQNLEVQNFVLENNSHYFGNTSPVYGGNAIELYGNMTLGQNSKMTLASRDTGGQGENGINSSNMAIYFRSSSANLNVAKDAVLNIIPLASQTANRLSGGIFMSGGNITVDGGTINFQAYNGTAGYYNQAIDMQGASTIKVINGGLVKALEAGLPQTTGTYYTSDGRQATLYGLIANENNNGNFYVGNGGNLIVGLTDQNGGYVTPYYGNLTINGVGSDHVIFYNNNTTNNTFQTGGNQKGINAYNVGIKDSSNRITPLYYFNLPSGSVNYTGVDGSGNPVSGSVNTTQLEIQSIPAVQFVGTSGVSVDNNGNTVITSYAKLTNYNSILGQKLYYQVGYSGTDPQGNFNNLTTYPNSSTQDLYSNADPNLYTGAINVPTNYAGEIIPVTFVLQKSAIGNVNPQFVGMRFKYGLTSVNNIVNTSPSAGTNNYTITIEGYNTGSNGKVTENGDMGITAGSTAVQQNGIVDGLADASAGNTNAKNAESFATRTSTDYTGAYNDAQSGYAAFNKNSPLSLDDLKQTTGFNAAVNPVAYIQGYQKAAYDAGVSDAHFGITSPQLQNIPGYQDGVNQYNQAYLVGLDPSKASLPLSTLQSQYGLASTYLGIPASATTTGLSDAQGALSFVQDERNAIINSTSGGYGTVLSNPTQKNAYLDAEAGYFNAVKNVSNPTAANPNPNASKAEQAGFQYGQSLINGALAKQRPTVVNPSAGIYNLSAAQSAYDAVQAALIHAVSNISSESSTTSHGALSDDSYVGDKTVYKSIKYGYYKAAQGQTDINLTSQTESKLDLLEEVGYILYVQPKAYEQGAQTFNNKQANTAANNPYNNSTIGQQSFNSGFSDAQTAFNQGQSDGLNTVKNSANPQGVQYPNSVIPANYQKDENLSSSYYTGYKGAVDGYKDGVSSTTGSNTNNNPTNQTTANYETSYQNGNAQGRQQAGANDYVNNTVSQTVANSDTNYATGVNTAAQGHSDGYSQAQSQPGNSNITTNNTDKTYVTGFNTGVSDERLDATKNIDASAFNQGAQDYINNLPISVSGHEKYYIAYYSQGYDAARQGLLDARDGKSQSLPTFTPSANKADPTYVNSSTIVAQFTTNLQNAYKLGYNSFKNDVTTGFSDSNNALANNQAALTANDGNKLVAYNVAADIFNTQLASLENTKYNNQQSPSGTLYTDLQSWFNTQAQADYQNGESIAKKTTVPPTAGNTQPQISFGFLQAGFNDLTNGYNGTTGNTVNTKSQGYVDGVKQQQNLNTGINTAKTSVQNNTPSDPDQLDAYNGTKAGYMDVATGSKTITSQYDKVFVDAYNKAYSDGASLANEALQQLSQNQSATDATLNADGAKNVAYTAAYKQVMDGYHSVLRMTTGSTPDSNANYQQGQTVGHTFMNDYNAAEAKSNPKVSDSPSQTYHGVVDALNNASANGTIQPITSSPNGTLYIDGYNRAVADINKASADAVRDFDNGVQPNPSQESTAAIQAGYTQAYQALTTGFKQGLSNPNSSAPANTNAAAGFVNGQATAKGYADAIKDFNNGSNNPNANTEPGYADTMNALLDAQKKQRNNNNTTTVYGLAYSQALGANDGLAAVKNNSSTNDIPTNVPSTVNPFAYQDGYQGSVDGYKDGSASTEGTSTNNSAAQANNPIYQNAYKQGNTAGRLQAGANDYTNGTVSQAEQQQDKNYATGVSIAENGYQDGASGVTKQGQDKPYTTGNAQGIQSADGVKQAQALNSTDNGLSGDSKSAYYGVKDAYAYVANPNIPNTQLPSYGVSGINTQSNAYQAAFVAAKAKALSDEAQGVATFQASQDNTYDTTSANATVDTKAMSNGYNQAQKGYNASTTNTFDTTNKSASYIAGNTMYNDIQSGINDAKTNPTLGANYTGSAVRVAAYDGTAGAFNDVLKNTPNASATPLSRDANQSKAYVDAYNRSRDIAIQDGANGALAYVRGQNQATGSDADSQAFNYGYGRAQTGFSDSKNIGSAQASDAAYMTGYNAYQSENAGNSDAVNGNTSSQNSVSDKQSYTDAINAYRDAYGQLLQNPDATTLPDMTGKSPAYKDAYNVAVGELKLDYQTGYQALANNEVNGVSVPAGSNQYSTAMRAQGLSEAQKGFRFGYLSQPLTLKTTAAKYGQSEGQQILAAIRDVSSTGEYNTQSTDLIYITAGAAATDAKNAVDNNPDVSNQPSQNNANNNNPVYPIAYTNAVNTMQANYQNGAQQYLSSQAAPANATYEYTMGYNDAQNGFAAGFNGTSMQNNHSQTQVAQTAGQKALQGYNDAVSTGQINYPAGTDQNQIDANNGASQALTDISNGLSNNDSAYTSYSNAFKLAYAKVKQAAQTAYDKGASGYVNGDSNTTATDPISKVQSAGYNAAKQGHDLQQAGQTLTEAQKNNSALNTGFNDSKSGNEGLAAAGSNTTPNMTNWTQPQKDGYQGTVDAYANGQSDGQMPDLTGKSQAYKDAYTTSYNDAKQKATQGANAALTGQPVDQTGWTQKQKDAYATGVTNANNAYKQNQDNVNATNPYSAGSDGSESFDGAKAGFADGTNGGQTSLDGKSDVFKAAYNKAQQEARQNAQAGIDEFTANKSNTANATATDAKNVAHNDGYTQAQAGYNGQTGPGINTNDPAYKAGQQLRTDENTGVSAAQQATGSDDKSFTPVNASQKAAYDAALAGITAGANNNNNGQSVSEGDSAQAKAYTDAYTQAHALGMQKAADGANAFNAGQADNSDKSLAGQAQSQGYKDAQSGHDAAVNKQTPTEAQRNNPSFMAGYNAAQSARTGLSDIEKGATTPTSHADNSAYTQAQQAYKDASDSIAANPDNPAATTNTSPAYQEIYKQAQADLKNNYDSGKQQFMDAQSSANTSGASSDQGKGRISQGYADAQAGFNAAINGQTITNPNDAQKAGMDAAKTVTDTVKASVGGSYKNSSDPVAQAANNATQSAHNDILSDPDHADVSTDPSIANNPVKAAAYKQAQEQYKANYDAGTNSYLNNTTEPSDDLGKKGYQEANEGFTAGFSGQTSIANQHSAAQSGLSAGEQALAGYNNALSLKDENANAPQVEKDGNNGAKQAFADAKNNTSMSASDLAKEPVAFQAAYNKAKEIAKQAITDGATAFASGQVRPTVTDAITDAQAKAYDDARSGYDAAKTGATLTQEQKNNPSFMAGVKAYQDAQTGRTLFNEGKSLPGDATTAENLAYNATKDAYTAGASDQPQRSDLNQQPGIYQDEYSDSYADAQQKAQSGASEAFGNSTSKVDQSTWTQAQKDAYNTGKANAEAGFDKTKQDVTAQNNYPTGSNSGEAFDGAKAGFSDGKSGATTDLTNKTQTFINAYNAAKQEAQQAAKAGADQFNAQQSDSADANAKDALSVAHVNGYTQAQNGYNAQNNNTVDNGNKDTSYQSGVQTAKDVAKGSADALTDPSKKDSYNSGSAAQDAAYKATVNGYLDGSNGNNDNATTTDPSQAKAYNDAYQAAKQKGEQSATTGAISYIAGNTKPTGNSAESLAQQKGYQDATDGYNAATNKDATIPTNATDAYKTGFNANKSGQAGINDIENGTTTANVVDSASYNKAQKAYDDASKAISSNPDSPATASDSSPVYKTAYTKAVNDLKQNYQNGTNQFVNGSKSADTSGAKSNQAKTQIEQGYADVQRGFNDKIDGKTTNNANDTTQKGADMAQKVIDSVNGVATDNVSSSNDPIVQTANSAAGQAKQDLQNDPDHSTISDDASIQNNPIKAAAYKVAVNQMHQQYADGSSDYLNNQTKPSTDLGNQGYNDAQAGFAAGFNGTSVPNEHSATKAGQTAGQSALSSYQEALSNKKDTSGDAMQQQANSAALQAFDDAKNLKTTDISKEPFVAYQLAYQKAQQDAAVATTSGATAFANGETRPTGDDALSQVKQAAYDYAKSGYEAARDGKITDDDKKNPSFMAGVDAYNQSVKGHDAYVNGEKLPDDASSAEKAGYTAAQDAYSSGKNDSAKPSDLGSKPEAYQDVYNNAYADAQAKATIGASEAFNNTTPVSQDGWTQAQKTAYAAGKQNAIAAYNDTKSDNTKANPNATGTDAAQAFDGAKAGFAAGSTGITPDLSGKSNTFLNAFNKAKNEASAAANDGLKEYEAGNSDSATASNDSLNQAHKAGYQAVSDGYQAQKAGNADNNNQNVNYQAGINLAKQLANGTNDATTNPSNNGNEYKSTPAQEAAYQATLNGYKDGANGNSDNQTPTDASQSVVYNDAYAAAKQQAQMDAATGASDFNKGLDKPYGADSHSIAQAKGYQDASDGYQLAKNNNVASLPSGATTAYVSGYNAYKSSQAGLNDVENNTTTDHVDNDAYAKAQKAYTDASNAIAANPDKPQTSQYKDPAYVDAYNKAVSDLQANYQTGQQQFDSGKNVADTTGVTSQQAKDRLAQGYADTKSGFDSVVNNTPISNPNAAQKDGIKSAKTVQDAVSGIVNSNTDSNNQDPVYTSATQAAQQAKTDLVDNPGHSTNSDDSTIQNNPIKKAAYKQAIQAMQVQYNEGANAFVSNQPEPSDKLGQDGYQDAQQGFNTGFAGTKVSDNADSGIQTGNKYGLSALNGYQDAYNGVSNSNTDDAPRNDANKAALQAFDDAKTGNVTDLSDKSLAYQSAYKKAQGDAKQALIQGAQTFADGNASPAVTNAPSGVAAKAYADAVAGYKAAQAGGNYTDEQKANPQFMVGVNAYNDMVSGRQLFTSGGQLTGNESASEKAGYLAAQAAFAAGKNDEPKDSTLANKSVQYQDAYNNAYDNAKQIATSGANDAYATNPSTDTSKLSSTELDAYNAGKQNAKTAYNAIKGDITTANNNIVDSDAYNSFEGAKAGFAAGKTGNDTSLDGKSTAYINAYKSAKNEAAQAAAAGLAEFAAGKPDTATNSNDALNVAHKNAFDQATAGYNAQVNGQINQNNNDKSYLAGVQTASDMQTGYNDALTNPNRSVYNGTAAQEAAYHATANGFHDGSYGTNNSTPTDATQAKAYADAYNKALSAGQAAALAGATTYNSGSAKTDDNSATGQAAQKGYDDAKQGHDDAMNNVQAPSNPSAAYQSGAQAVADGKSGANDFNGQKDANANYTSGNINVQTGHDGAKDGYLDAVQGNTKKSFDTSSNKTQAYQDQYSAEYDKALAKASLGAQNQFTNNNQDMTNWTQADKNAYQAGQASASQGYNEARQNPDDTTHTGNTNVDESFKGAAAAFNDVKNGEEGQNGTSDASPVYQDAYQVALNAAKQVANNGATSFGNGQDLATQVAKLGNNQSDKNAFTKGYNDAQAAYGQAQQTPSQASPYATGTNSNLVFEAAQNAFSDVKNGEAGAQANKSSDPAYVAAYQRALNEAQPVATNGASGFSNGVNLQQQLESFGNNQAQKDAYTKGYNDAQTAYGQALQNANDNADHKTSSNGDETYRGASAALLDVKNGTAGQHANAEQSAPYQAAYAKALAQAQAQSNAGATAFGNNADLNSALGQFGNNQALSDTFAKGYNDASAGYTDAQKDANMSSTHSTNGDKDEVYRGAADAFNAVSRGENPTPDASQTNAAYLASFSRAKDQALQIAKDAAVGFNKGTAQQDLLSAQGDNKALQNAVSRGYVDAQTAYSQAEAQPDTTTHQTDSNADKTFHGASLAFSDVKNGTDGNSRPDDSDAVAQSAYDKALSYAQGVAKNGSDAFIKGATLDNTVNSAGANQSDKDAIAKGYNDAQTAYAEAQQNPTENNPYAANTNSNLVFAAVANAIADVKANNVGAQANASTDKVYVDAYQRALNEAQPQATNGATGFGQGVNLADELAKFGNNQVQKDAYSRGYNDAQTAYAQALQNANDGSDHASSSNGDEVYRGAAAALQDVKNGHAGQNANAEQSAPFRAAYAKALQEAQSQANAGATAFGNSADLNSSLGQFGNNQALKDVFTTGYTDANNGFNAAQQDASKADDHKTSSNEDVAYVGAADAFNAVAQDKNATPDASQTNPAYISAFNRAKALANQLAQTGAVGFNQGKSQADLLTSQGDNNTLKNEISRGYTDAQTAYGQAKSKPDTESRQTDTNADQTFHGSSLAFNDVKLGQLGSSRPADSDVVAQSAYDKALAEAIEILRTGITGYLSDSQLSDLLDRVGDNQSDRDAITKGYNDAQKAYAQAQQNPDQNSPYTANSTNDLVFKAVVNAINDVKSGNDGAQAKASNDIVYIDAYQKALQTAQPETTNGATGFGNDVNLNDQLATFGDNQSQRAAYSKGYSDAQNGYNLALQNANDGVNHTTNSNEDTVYRGAAAALNDIKNGNPGQYANAEQGAPYKAAYAKALAYASQIAKNAGVTYLQNGSLNDSLGQFGGNQSVKDVFTKGYNDAKVGIELVQLGTDQLASHTNGNNVDNTYRGSVLALIDINSNRPNNHLSDSNDPVFIAAYQREAQIAQQAANNGAKAYTEGLTESAAINKYSATPEDAAAIKMGYEQSQSGYNDGNQANAQSKSDNPYYQVGFTYADSAYKGYQAAQSNGKQSTTGNVATDDAYQATIAASADANKGIKQDVSGKSLAYQVTYQRAYDYFLAKKKAAQESDFSKVSKKYYKKNYKLYRVSNKHGARMYMSPKFTKHNWITTLQHGDLIKVIKIVRYGKTTRLYVGHGEYVTGNKDYVVATQLAKADKKKTTKKVKKTTKKKVVKKVTPVIKTKPAKKKVVKKTETTKKPTVVKKHKTKAKQTSIKQIHKKTVQTNVKKTHKKVVTPVIKKQQTINNPGYSVTVTPTKVSRYYRKNYTEFRLQKDALIHTSKNFTDRNWVSTLRRGDIIRVEKVVKFHGITRFYIGKGRYVTSNKSFVIDEKTYEQRKATQDVKKYKASHKSLPKNLSDHSDAYVDAYLKEFYRGSNAKVTFRRKKTDTNSKTTSNKQESRYYRKNHNKFRVIAKNGIRIHTDLKFNDKNWTVKLQRGNVFKVQKIVKYYGITRLYIGQNEYVTGNTSFVREITD
ncbi:DUF5776 domain-containing protein [Apilactobacillus sp. EABW-1NA]|uniref:DUF5776 domain-containing protein n=1 Tax=Apilactobacillus sp. EABW-1NA TaxID=2984137 RepID=UPI0025B02F27|nr:DUF5776 domain-containing protein [Apilactobacillus sp. EABW-1NA]MDN2612040.1 DUF5776 domain-containing protein [Apilactobacillus sp. EABW-1NA]